LTLFYNTYNSLQHHQRYYKQTQPDALKKELDGRRGGELLQSYSNENQAALEKRKVNSSRFTKND
jgi:sRNA-binding protein